MQFVSARFWKGSREMLELERRILDEYQICKRDNFTPNLNYFVKNDIEKLYEKSKEEYWNVELLDFLLCTFATDFTNYNDRNSTPDLERRAKENNVKNAINELKELASGADGRVWTADFLKYKRFLVIKTSLREDSDTLFHDFFVGVKCLNHLRRKIPNFVYTYTYFKCGKPIDFRTDKEKQDGVKIITNKFCDIVQDRNSFVLMEEVVGETFHNYLSRKQVIDPRDLKKYGKLDKNALKKQLSRKYANYDLYTVDVYLAVMLQIISALNMAWKECKFTHYDLHDANVFLRRLPKGNDSMQIEYEGEGVKYYLKVPVVATIIDFGRSHVQIGNEHFYYTNDDPNVRVKIQQSGHKDKDSAIWDVYKIVCFSLFAILTSALNADGGMKWPIYEDKETPGKWYFDDTEGKINVVKELMTIMWFFSFLFDPDYYRGKDFNRINSPQFGVMDLYKLLFFERFGITVKENEQYAGVGYNYHYDKKKVPKHIQSKQTYFSPGNRFEQYEGQLGDRSLYSHFFEYLWQNFPKVKGIVSNHKTEKVMNCNELSCMDIFNIERTLNI